MKLIQFLIKGSTRRFKKNSLGILNINKALGSIPSIRTPNPKDSKPSMLIFIRPRRKKLVEEGAEIFWNCYQKPKAVKTYVLFHRALTH